MTKIIKVTINRTVQFDVKYNGDDSNDAYEEIKQAFENNSNKLDELLGDAPYKTRYEVDSLDKVVLYDCNGSIISEENAPNSWQ